MSDTINGGATGTDAMTPALIPRPTSVTWLGEFVPLHYTGRVVEHDVPEDANNALALQIVDEIERATGLTWQVAKGGNWRGDVMLSIDSELQSQAYHLDIAGETPVVRLVGGSLAGVRNGVQTLRQIIRQCAPLLPAVQIRDTPTYTKRGYYLDVTRGRVPTLAWLKRWADKLAFYKYNQLQLYIEHVFQFDGFSEGWRGTSPLNASDIIAFDDYCSSLGIELIPSISTFGHHYVNLRTKTFRDMGEFPEDADRPFSFVERQEHHTLNITDPRAMEFSTHLIDQTMDLFNSNTFNICADETFDLGRGRSRVKAASEGIPRMYADYVAALCRHVSDRGHVPEFWGDIAVQMPEILSMLPKDAILLNWLYAPDITEEKVKLVADSGATQVVCPAVQAWNGLLPKIDDAWSNISRLSSYGVAYHAAGILITDWGDYGHVNDPRMSIPGMVYGAQCAWNPTGPDHDAVDRDLSRIEYGDKTGTYMQALRAASASVAFGWDDAVEYLELDDGSGHVNHDVLSAIAWRFPQDQQTNIDKLDLAHVRQDLLAAHQHDFDDISTISQRLDAANEALGLAIGHSNADRSDVAGPALIAIEGQRLFNLLGVKLAHRYGLSAHDSSIPDALLAAQLETWFEHYCKLWRSVSRESELGRVASVVWRCSDLLRSPMAGMM